MTASDHLLITYILQPIATHARVAYRRYGISHTGGVSKPATNMHVLLQLCNAACLMLQYQRTQPLQYQHSHQNKITTLLTLPTNSELHWPIHDCNPSHLLFECAKRHSQWQWQSIVIACIPCRASYIPCPLIMINYKRGGAVEPLRICMQRCDCQCCPSRCQARVPQPHMFQAAHAAPQMQHLLTDGRRASARDTCTTS
jgi:hypothetical protein